MIVVSNTSPLTSLAAIGHFELLRKLYGEIHIAQGVWHELNQGGRRHPGSHEVENASWIDRVLLQAKRLSAIPEVRPLLDALREQAGFFLGERLYWQVLERAGESATP